MSNNNNKDNDRQQQERDAQQQQASNDGQQRMIVLAEDELDPHFISLQAQALEYFAAQHRQVQPRREVQ